MSSNTFIFNVPQPIKNTPYKQLKIDGRHGWLRKKITKTFRRIVWEKKKVVLRDGCLYVFKNEESQSYEKAFSLFGYNEISKAQEVQSAEAAFPFKICYALDSKEQVKYFSADSSHERAEWMIAIRKEMLKVHKIETSLEQDEGQSTDTEVPISTIEYFENVKRIYSSVNESDSDLEPEYYPEEESPKLPPPPVEIKISSNTEISKNGHFEKPIVPPKPAKEKYNLESSARWNGTREQGKRVLVKYGHEGSYMIRSSSDGCDVLLVISDYNARKFKIFKKNKKLYLAENDECFDDINSLLMHYKSQPLPKIKTKLKDPYTERQQK